MLPEPLPRETAKTSTILSPLVRADLINLLTNVWYQPGATEVSPEMLMEALSHKQVLENGKGNK